MIQVFSIVFSTFMVLWLFSCKESPQTSAAPARSDSQKGVAEKEISDGEKPNQTPIVLPPLKQGRNLTSLTLAELNGIRLERKSQDKADRNALQEFLAINEAYCSRLEQLRFECSAAYPLIPQEQLNVSCLYRNDQVSTVKLNYRFSAAKIFIQLDKIPDEDQPFILLANEKFASSEFFADGEKTEIQFAPTSDDHGEIPQFRQLSSLLIRRKSKSKPLPAIHSMKARIEIETTHGNGEKKLSPLLTWDLENPAQQPDNSHYAFNLRELVSYTTIEQCVISDIELQKIKNEAKQAVRITTEGSIDSGSTLNRKPGSTAVMTTTEQLALKEKMIEEMELYEKNILAIQPQLSQARDNFVAISNELQSNNLMGCHYSQPIKNYDIQVEGEIIPFVVVAKSSTFPFRAYGGDPKAIVFELANNISMMIHQFQRNIQGSLQNEATIGDIAYLKIKRTGVTFENYGWNGGADFASPVFGEKTRYKIYELHRYEIRQVDIRINERVIFSQKFAHPIELRRDSMESPIIPIRSDPNWLNLMKKSDCRKGE